MPADGAEKAARTGMSSEKGDPGNPPLMPLTMAAVGQRVLFVRAEGGYGLTRRLAEMGLTPGEVLEVINCGRGPYIVSVRGGRLVLGRGMVHRIFVRPV